MGYLYATEKPKLFTEEGQVLFLKIRDQVKQHIGYSGAVRCDKALSGVTGNSWEHLACLDRMVELGELICLSPTETWGQYKVYTEISDRR